MANCQRRILLCVRGRLRWWCRGVEGRGWFAHCLEKGQTADWMPAPKCGASLSIQFGFSPSTSGKTKVVSHPPRVIISNSEGQLNPILALLLVNLAVTNWISSLIKRVLITVAPAARFNSNCSVSSRQSGVVHFLYSHCSLRKQSLPGFVTHLPCSERTKVPWQI